MKMEKAYEPKRYEAGIYKLWEESGAFEPQGDPKKKPFCIIMPPPNANGSLHTGHAMYTVEDVITRFKRMQGHPTLWLPGTDHAGIETQYVYEQELAKQGKSRFDLGPTQFYNDLLTFTRKHQGQIVNQLKSLGLSADWSKLKFTLDEDVIEIVYDTFKKLHDDGLIYRGNRIVNWCTRCNAAFADVEIKHIEREDEIYTLDYGSLKIATTRPETIFADVAIAVNPKDKRYKKLIGQSATIPLVNRPIPIVADTHVDPDFGTGALKVTPGHDAHDYEIGIRHTLPEITVVDPSGKMINVPEQVAGLSVGAARLKTVSWLEKEGKMAGRKSLIHSVGTHDRCGTVIEPLITEQWFMHVKPLVEPAIKAVKEQDTKLYPDRFKKVLISWLENLHDWNISRQIWWGIRIPVYYKTSNDPHKEAYIISWEEKEAIAYYGRGNYRAETDTFDTWFSSSQWPHITLMTTGEFKRFYPTAFMGTARDILTKWVATMMMMGLYRTDKVPFSDVYLWGMVNDEHGKKMSKSKGNVVDPLRMTEKYGTDALRLALTLGITPGNDGSLSERKIESYRNFCNKLWNVARFTLEKADDSVRPGKPEPKSLADWWILDKLTRETTDITAAIENYKFSEAGERIYSLLWNDLADWYIEASKKEVNPGVLVYCLETILKLAHPFAPFVTEAIWQKIPWQKQNLITAAWPDPKLSYSAQSKHFEQIMALVSQIRSIKTTLGISKPSLLFKSSKIITDNLNLIEGLAGTGSITESKQGSGLQIPVRGMTVWIDVDQKTVNSYQKQLQKQSSEIGGYLKKLTSQLANKRYIESAPSHLIQQTRERKKEAGELKAKLDEQIKAIK
ncbi:MAG TPA: valine--tRNA ligase [Candidatus Dormibacteraeota bacterium]|nr:valine--tRNA ligase [Candidatus Dormibacteraeota bacterium]